MDALLPQAVEDYLHRVAPESEPVLRDMERIAAERDFPIIGPLVGRLLFVLARALGAETVFELGSGYGYSGIWFAKALAPHGRVVMTEGDPDNVKAARDHFERAGLLDRAVFETGDGLEVIDRYPGPFDIVFCDIDKRDYPRAFHKAMAKVRKGGLLITDNVLWSGKVAAEAQDEATAGIQEYNRLLMSSPDLCASILPLRDGVAVAVRL